MAGASVDAPTCVEFARAERIDPAGSAGHYCHLAVVEIPLPWPRDIGEHPQVAPYAAALKAAGARVQAVVPQQGSTPGARQLAHYWLPPGPFSRYSLTEREVTDRSLGTALADLAAEVERTGRTEVPGPPSGSSPTAAGPGRTEVLVCSHGKRDQCCGTFGTRLAAQFGEPNGNGSLDGMTGRNGTLDVRLWRTSHTGGHRFAPTALVLPEGTAWAFLDAGTLEGILDRTLDVGTAGSLYRGCTALDDPAIQVCDRDALRTVGWSWLDYHRSGRVLERSGDRTRVRLDYTTPAGEGGAFEATVEVVRRLPVPECRRPLSESRKEAPELRALTLRSLT